MEKKEKFKNIKEMQKDVFKKVTNIFLSLFTAFASSDEEIRKIENIKEEISEEEKKNKEKELNETNEEKTLLNEYNENEDENKKEDNIVQEKIMNSTMKIFKNKIDSNR